MIKYEIVAIPRPQGSKRHVGRGIMVESSKHIKNWRAFARLKAEEAMKGHSLIDKPTAVLINVRFYFDRPQKHFQKADCVRTHLFAIPARQTSINCYEHFSTA